MFTDRNCVQDSKTILGTQSLYQVQGAKPETSLSPSSNNKDGKYNLHLFNLQCSCINCLNNPHKVNLCFYQNGQHWRKITIEEKRNEQPAAIDYCEFTFNKLKDILRDRDSPVLGHTDDLVERSKTDDKSNNMIVGNKGCTEKK